MRYHVMGLLRTAALECKRHDPATAYAVLELANNLRLVMREEASVEDFLGAYTGHEGDPIDIDRILPIPAE